MRKLVILLILILFVASSSGVVVFAFECREMGHLHFSILHKITCADFDDEDEDDEHSNCNHQNNNCSHCHCENKENGKLYIKILSLGIDIIEIAKKHIQSINTTQFFIPDVFLAEYKNYLIKPNHNSYKPKTILFTDISNKIIEYIHKSTSNTSEEPPII
jgi:hypothetical protein